MKYRTVIELICEADSAEDALDTAGEYLRSNIDCGVQMKSKASSLSTYRTTKYVASLLIAFLFISVGTLGLRASNEKGSQNLLSRLSSQNVCTVQPELKTKHEKAFKEAWEIKSKEEMLDFLKK